MGYLEDLNVLRSSEEYRKLPADKQYKVQLDVLAGSLKNNDKFMAAGPEQQKQVIQKVMEDTYSPVFENPEMESITNRAIGAYKAGDETARQAMITYFKGSYFNERLATTARWVRSGADSANINRNAGMPDQYATSVLAINKTKGADDNKARQAFMRAMTKSGDQEAIDAINVKKLDRLGIATRVGEGVLVGLLTAATAGAVTGVGAAGAGAAGVAAKAGIGAKGILTAFASKTIPFLAVEAGLEGALGVGEYMADQVQAGEAASIKGATGAFGLYAGLDVAANVTLSTIFPILRYTSMPFVLGKAGKGQVAADALAASMRNPDGLVSLKSVEIDVHHKAYEMYADTTKNFKSSADLEGLSEIKRLNYDAYEMGYSVAKEDNIYHVVPHDNPRAMKDFDNMFEAKEWMATTSVNKRLQAKLDDGAIEDTASFIERHASLVKRKLLRDNIDQAWTVPKGNTGKRFVSTSNRQILAPEEVDAVIELQKATGTVVRFDKPMSAKLLKKKQVIFKANEEVIVTKEMINENGNAILYASSIASPNDWAKAMAQGTEAAAREGGFTPKQWAMDKLIASNYQAAYDSTGALHAFFPDRLKVVSARVNPAKGRVGNLVIRPESPETVIKISSTYRTPAEAIASNPKAMAKVSHKFLAGEVDAKSIQTLSETLSLKNKTKGLTFRVNTVSGDAVQVVKKGKDVYIEIPKKIGNAAKQKKVYAELINKIDRISGGNGNVKRYIKAFNNIVDSQGIPLSVKNKTKWAKKLIGDGEFNVQPESTGFKWQRANGTQTGVMQYADDMDDLINKLTVQNMEPGLIEVDLMKKGLTISKDPNFDIIKIMDGDQILSTGEDLTDAAIKMNYVPSKIPSTMAPNLNATSKLPEFEMQITKEFSIGDQVELTKFLSKFDDYRKTAMSSIIDTKPDGSKMVKISNSLYQVDIPSIGHSQQFTNAKDARNYLRGDWKTYTNLQKSALDKGFRMSFEDGNYVLKTGNKTIQSKNIAEVYDELAKVPRPTFGKTIIPANVQAELDNLGIEGVLPPGFGRVTIDAVDDLPAKEIDSPIKKLTGDLRDILLPKRASIRRSLAKLNDPAMNKTFGDIENHARLAHLHHQKNAKEAFDLMDGLSIEKRKGILHWIENEGEAASLVADKFGLTNDDLLRGAKLSQEIDRIGNEIGIPLLDKLKNYQPRIRKMLGNLDPNQITGGTVDDLFKDPIGQKIFNTPEMKKFFARYDRVNELIEFARDEDALSVFLSYSKKGTNEFYLRGHLNDMKAALKLHGDALKTSNLHDLLKDYYEGMTHASSTIDQKVLNQTAGKLMRKFGLDGEDAKRWVDLGINASYMTNMSWRPWQPFRNLWQVYNVLPLKTGNPMITTRAIKKFVKDPDKYLGEMLGRGVFPDDASMAAQLRELYVGKFPKGFDRVLKFGQEGLNWFKASDHSTRIVAGLAADELMDKAFIKAGVGPSMNEKLFLKASRLENFSQPVQDQVMALVREGKEQASKDVFAREMVNETMFDYTRANKPLMAKGVLGSLYYQYMTYPLNLLNSIGTSMANGTVASKAKSLIALGTGMGAIYGAMKSMGIDGSQFLTWNQISISGGPLWNDLYLLTQLGEKGMVGMQAKQQYLAKFGISKEDGELAFNKYPQILPGRIQAKYFMRAMEAAEEGDFWKMYLYLTTTPTDKNWAEDRG